MQDIRQTEDFYNKHGIFFDLDSNLELANKVYSLAVEQEKERIKEKIDKLPRYGTSQHTIPPNFWAYKCEDVEGVISNQQ